MEEMILVPRKLLDETIHKMGLMCIDGTDEIKQAISNAPDAVIPIKFIHDWTRCHALEFDRRCAITGEPCNGWITDDKDYAGCPQILKKGVAE